MQGKRILGRQQRRLASVALLFLSLLLSNLKFTQAVSFFNVVGISLDKGKTAKEEARELLLKEESSVRDRVDEIQKNLSLMLRTLGDMAIANSVFAHSRLPSMVLAPANLCYNIFDAI